MSCSVAAFLPKQTRSPVASSAACRRIHPAVKALYLGGAVFALVSCSRPTAPPENSKTQTLLRAVYPAVSYGPATDVVDIYVDDSGSMRGFTTVPASNYRRLIAEVWNSAAESKLNWTTHTFSSAKTSGNRLRQEEVEGPTFYSALDTPLTRIIHQVAQNLSQQPSHAAILISDLVQSEPTKDSVDLATELSRLADLHPEMKLLGYRSDFNGSYSPESRGGPKFNMRNSQSIEGEGRPFYVLMVAPNPETMRNLQKYLLNDVKEVEAFDPTTPPLTVESAGLTPDPAGHSSWVSYSKSLSNDQVPARVDTSFQLKSSSSTGSMVLPVTLKYRAEIPLRDVNSLGVESFRATGETKEPVQAQIPLSATADEAHAAMLLQMKLARPAANAWDVYLIRLRAGDANLGVPQWINDWDTANDADPRNGNRTYQLKVLAQTMVNNITEKEVCAEWILKVGGSR